MTSRFWRGLSNHTTVSAGSPRPGSDGQSWEVSVPGHRGRPPAVHQRVVRQKPAAFPALETQNQTPVVLINHCYKKSRKSGSNYCIYTIKTHSFCTDQLELTDAKLMMKNTLAFLINYFSINVCFFTLFFKLNVVTTEMRK